MPIRVPAGLASLLLLVALLPSSARAQVVVGRVVEAGDGTPVATAFVVLLDAEGRRRAAGLTGDGGRFALEAPEPGRYRLRVDRIGYRSTTTEPFAVSADGAAPLTIEVPGQAIRVDPIEVGGERRCVLRPEEGEVAYALWSEARKALEITEWAAGEDRFVFDVLHFKRLLRPPELVVDTEIVELVRIDARQPFHADSAGKLLRRGFVRGAGLDLTFSAPDAPLLLSDAFLDTHCFRPLAADSAGLVGLAFEPVDREARGDIRGVLWLERRSAELRFMEYRYVNAPLPAEVDPARYGGIVRFRPMPDGSWIIGQWRIRSPIFSGAGRRVLHRGFTETEGDVHAVRTAAGDPVPYERAAGRLTGRVLRRGSGDPVAGAKVRILGTPYETVTDDRGRFGFEGLPEGRYRVEADGPGIRRIESTVHMSPGATTRLTLAG